MPLIRDPFEPLPADTEWVGSLEDVDLDDHDWHDDADDATRKEAPPIFKRLAEKVIRRG